MLPLLPRLAVVTLLTVAATTAHADNTSWFTLGVGAQYSYVSGAAGAAPEMPAHQYGVVSRLKLLKFLGAEFTAQLDQDPKTQPLRHLSPRYQLGAMVNLIPTQYFNVFVVGGLAAHAMGDLVDIAGRTTSFHAGPGLEVYLGDHVAIGGDLRWRAAGPEYIEARILDELSARPVDELVGLDLWQANFTLSWYL